MDENEQKKMAHLVSTVLGVLNMTTAFAAPRFLAKADISKRPTREQLLGLYDDFLAIMNRTDRPYTEKEARAIAAARRMRTEFETWDFSLQAPEPVVTAARELLAALDAGAPDEEWDQWEGPEE